MKCKKAELRLIEADDAMKENAELIQHLKDCAACRQFAEGVQRVRAHARTLRHAEAPHTLASDTAVVCLNYLTTAEKTSRETVTMPKIMWIILGFICLSTLLLLSSLSTIEVVDTSIFFPIGVALMIIFQNTFMLLFAPLIIKKRHALLAWRTIELS